MKSQHVLIFALCIAIACGSHTAFGAADDWISKSGPKILIMPKSAKSAEFVPYSDVIPQLVRDDKKPTMTIYDFAWPLSASKETGQWLQIEDGGSVSRHPRKCWINKGQLTKLDGAAAQYNEQIQKKPTGPDARAYHWLLGVVLEQQQQKAAARFQYQQAFKKNHDQDSTDPSYSDMAASRAKWGFARVSSDLFQGDPKGADKQRFRDSVRTLFGDAKGKNNDVPGFFTDWGQALEKALPAASLAFVDRLFDMVEGPDTCYPENVSIPKDPIGAAPPDSQTFKGIRRDVYEILCKYYQAETHGPMAKQGDESGAFSETHLAPHGAPEAAPDRSEDDIGSLDLPHRLIGSLYARYRMKRDQADFERLFIDVDGVKSNGADGGLDRSASDQPTRTVTADDEFVRALRRNPNSRETLTDRARLQFRYFMSAHLDRLGTAALNDQDEILEPAKEMYKDAWIAKRDAQAVYDATQRLLAIERELVARYRVEDHTEQTVNSLITALANQKKIARDRDVAKAVLDDSNLDFQHAEREWLNVSGTWQRSLKRIRHILDRLNSSEPSADLALATADVKAALVEVSAYAPQVKKNWHDVDRWAAAQHKMLRTVAEDLQKLEHDSQFSAGKQYFLGQLAIFTDLEKAAKLEDAIWERAFSEADAAAVASTFRNDETLALLAQICYARGPLVERPERLFADDNAAPLPSHPLLSEAVRYEGLAVEYATDETKRLSHQRFYLQWYDPPLDSALSESIIVVEPLPTDIGKQLWAEFLHAPIVGDTAKDLVSGLEPKATSPEVEKQWTNWTADLTPELTDQTLEKKESKPLLKLYDSVDSSRVFENLDDFSQFRANNFAVPLGGPGSPSAPAGPRPSRSIRNGPPPLTDWSGFATP